MTEKRFKVINISENGMKGLFQLGNDNLSIYDVARLLNELLEENKQLKQDKTNLHRTMSRDRVRYLQFRDKVFWCIDKKIDEFKNGNYGDLPCNTIHMFLDLKQEIGDDLND